MLEAFLNFLLCFNEKEKSRQRDQIMKDFRLVQTTAYYEDRKEPDEKGHQDIMNYPFSHGGSHHSIDSFS